MSKKEFEDLFAGIQVYMPSLYGKLWQWIERQIKDARVDELENFVTSIIGESEYRDRKERLIMRIKELTGELK